MPLLRMIAEVIGDGLAELLQLFVFGNIAMLTIDDTGNITLKPRGQDVVDCGFRDGIGQAFFPNAAPFRQFLAVEIIIARGYPGRTKKTGQGKHCEDFAAGVIGKRAVSHGPKLRGARPRRQVRETGAGRKFSKRSSATARAPDRHRAGDTASGLHVCFCGEL